MYLFFSVCIARTAYSGAYDSENNFKNYWHFFYFWECGIEY